MDKTAIIRDLEAFGCSVKIDEPMKLHTSFKIGGPADLFVSVYNIDQLASVLRYASAEDLRILLVGNGSNMLVSDDGIRAIAVNLDGDFKAVSASGNCVRAGAGASLSAMCHAALENCLTGLEFAWGIPGSVGGAAFMNAGAYGGEMKDVVTRVEYITPTGETGEYTGEQCEFVYRGSVFQHNGYIVTAVTAELQPGERDAIRAQMDDILGRRKSKQPLEYPSAGSVFKRPVGYFAGGLIEQCGLKGATVGGAQVSEKHAGFIINIGGATCSDVLELISKIQKTVLENTGVELECEIKAIS